MLFVLTIWFVCFIFCGFRLREFSGLFIMSFGVFGFVDLLFVLCYVFVHAGLWLCCWFYFDLDV